MVLTIVCSVILTLSTFLCLIHVACQSTCFCAEHNLHAQPFYVWPFSETLVHTLLRLKFKPWFTQAPCSVCQKRIFLLNKNADSQRKKRVVSVSQKHHALHKHLNKSCSCFAFPCVLSFTLLGWLAGLLLSSFLLPPLLRHECAARAF